MPYQAAELPRLFQALSDPTRLAVVAQLAQGPSSMTNLARPFDMALPSFSQHLRVLEDCGMVRSSKSGRVRTYELQPKALEAAEHWLTVHRRRWETRLDQLDDYLKTLKKETP
jgi:DNA-binding transcriptional ArsR family regulator